MRVGVLGINHKLADLHLREILAKVCRRRFSAENSMHGSHAFVLLSTCNRTEIYFSSEDLAETHSYLLAVLRLEVEEEFDQKLYSYFSFDCFFHLARVTAGLDSAIVAETEIQGQVKDAYERTLYFTALPKELHYLFQKALKIGKDIRSKVLLKPGLPALEHAILNTGSLFFQKAKDTRLLFVGASEINCKIIAFLKDRVPHKMTLCNRSLQKAQEISQQFQMDLLEWSLLNQWGHYDWIIFGTKSPDHLIHTSWGLTPVNKKLIMDLSVPRNVDPSLGCLQGITLLNIDQINQQLDMRKRGMYDLLAQAEKMALDVTSIQHSLFHDREAKRYQFLAVS